MLTATFLTGCSSFPPMVVSEFCVMMAGATGSHKINRLYKNINVKKEK
jgi:hypothetical protein